MVNRREYSRRVREYLRANGENSRFRVFFRLSQQFILRQPDFPLTFYANRFFEIANSPHEGFGLNLDPSRHLPHFETWRHYWELTREREAELAEARQQRARRRRVRHRQHQRERR